MKTALDIGTLVTARDRALLSSLATARILDGEQLKIVGGFTALRRANRRLLKLVRAGILRRWFLGTASGGRKALYGLSPDGARLIGEPAQGLIAWKQDALITSSQFLAHQQAVNELWLRAQFGPLPDGSSAGPWQSFREPLSSSVRLTPDGYFVLRQAGMAYPMFVEADLGTESSVAWKRKVEGYLRLALSGEFERQFHEPRFRVLSVFPSARRRETIRRTVARRTEKLFWFATQADMEREGLCGQVWFRPKGAEPLSLP